MVLPSPTPPDAPPEAAHGILDRLRLILRLAEAGVLVLVDDARPEQLGTFVRMLLTVDPNIEVHTNALSLLNVPDGSAVVLVPNVLDATWLNQERPIFSQKRLRVLLYCDADTSRALAQKAPDFFHWISHRMEVPKGAWPPAVFGLRAAGAHAMGVAWQGGDFDAIFGAAFPDQAYSTRSAAMQYEELLDAMQREQGWLVLKDVDGLFRLRRIRWALTETARRGMIVLDQPATFSAEFWVLHGLPALLADAIRDLETAGAQHAGRLAASMHLEPEAVQVAANLLGHGIAETTIMRIALDNDDPGAALAQNAIENNLMVDENAPPVRRAAGPRPTPQEAIKLDDDHLLEAAGIAFEEGCPDIALRWTRRALARGVDRIDALMTLASMLMTQGQVEEAKNALNEALALEEQGRNDRRRRAEMLALFASLQQRTGKLHAARRTIEKALRLRKRMPDAENETSHAGALITLGRILESQGDLSGAEQVMRKAHQINTNARRSNPTLVAESLLDLARVLCERNALDEAKEALENSMRTFESMHGHEHRRVAACLHELGRVFLAKDQVHLANQAVEEALRIRRKINDERPTPDNANTFHLLGRIRANLGDFDGALDALDHAIQINRELFRNDIHPHIADSLHEIGLVLVGKGELAKARDFLEQTLKIELQIYGGRDHFQIAFTESNLGMVLAMMGERDVGLEMIRSAYQVLLAQLGPEHPVTRDAAMKLERFA